MQHHLAVKGERPITKVKPGANKRKPTKKPMQHHLAVKGERPTTKVKPDANKRKPTKKPMQHHLADFYLIGN
jgi:hypothetical protein